MKKVVLEAGGLIHKASSIFIQDDTMDRISATLRRGQEHEHTRDATYRLTVTLDVLAHRHVTPLLQTRSDTKCTPVHVKFYVHSSSPPFPGKLVQITHVPNQQSGHITGT